MVARRAVNSIDVAKCHHASGMLHHLILLRISDHPHTGYSLSQSIEQAIGKKPSWGSIYPLLSHLADEGLVPVKADGRKKVYTITAQGKRVAAQIKSQHDLLISSVSRNVKIVGEITGQDTEPVVAVFERMKRGERPLAPVEDEIVTIRNLLFTMALDGRLRRHSAQIRKIIGDARNKMERMT